MADIFTDKVYISRDRANIARVVEVKPGQIVYEWFTNGEYVGVRQSNPPMFQWLYPSETVEVAYLVRHERIAHIFERFTLRRENTKAALFDHMRRRAGTK